MTCPFKQPGPNTQGIAYCVRGECALWMQDPCNTNKDDPNHGGACSFKWMALAAFGYDRELYLKSK